MVVVVGGLADVSLPGAASCALRPRLFCHEHGMTWTVD